MQGEVGAVASVDCLDPTPGVLDDLDPARVAIVQPPDVPEFDGALVRIAADDVEVMGLVLQGHIDAVVDHPSPLVSLYDAAVSVGDAWSGTRVHHNLFRLNTLGVELGSSGVSKSRVDHNCFRDNRYAVANQRYGLTNGRIDDNTTFRTQTITFEVGWTEAGTTDVMVDHNISHDANFYVVYVDHSRRAQVVANDIHATGQGIRINPANEGVQVVGNTVTGAASGAGAAGVFVATAGTRPATTGLRIADNEVSADGVPGAGSGIGILMHGAAADGRGHRRQHGVHASATEGFVLAAGNHRLDDLAATP